VSVLDRHLHAQAAGVKLVRCPQVELEGQLSHPALPLLRLVRRWRQLPAGEPSRSVGTRRSPQRAEERLGPVYIAQLLADYKRGVATTELTRTYGLGKGAVLRLLEANDVARRRQSLTPDQVREAIRLYGLGWPLGRIGERFGRHHSVMLRALERAGVPRRDSHGRER
jgi:hypothetical protein